MTERMGGKAAPEHQEATMAKAKTAARKPAKKAAPKRTASNNGMRKAYFLISQADAAKVNRYLDREDLTWTEAVLAGFKKLGAIR